jgi:tetrahydromethanopterin S-methyltransferase subunit B
MTKKKETGVLASAKEETLNQIITAQKEKIEALTVYGKKLKKQVKDYKESMDANCEELIDTFQSDLLKIRSSHQTMLIAAIAGGILLGIFIGTFI